MPFILFLLCAGLPELPDPVYPIMVDINAGNEQMRRTLSFMKEGSYFSRMATKSVKVGG